MVMSYSRVLGHASTLAEQIQVASASDASSICVWQRDPARGSVEVHDVRPTAERRMQLGEFDLFIDVGAEAQLRDLRANGLPNETGGCLLYTSQQRSGASKAYIQWMCLASMTLPLPGASPESQTRDQMVC